MVVQKKQAIHFRVIKNLKEVVQDNISTKEEAQYCIDFLSSNGMTGLDIEEIKPEISGLGRDPDLHRC